MTAIPASIPPDSMPLPFTDLRLVQPPANQVKDRVGATDERAAPRNPYDAPFEPVFGLIEELRDLRNSPESTELWNAAYKTCQLQMESEDPRIVRWGMRFFMAIQRHRAKILAMELELVKSGIEQSTQITVTQIRNLAPIGGRGDTARVRAGRTE